MKIDNGLGIDSNDFTQNAKQVKLKFKRYNKLRVIFKFQCDDF